MAYKAGAWDFALSICWKLAYGSISIAELNRICLFITDYYYLDLPDDEPDTKCELKEGGKQAWAFTRAGW